MKLKVSDLYDLSLGLADLSEKELSISLSFKIQRASKAVSDELIASDKVRKKIIEKYKEKDLENGQVQIKKDKLIEFNKEMQELMKQEVEVSIDKIDIEDLEKADINIKPKTLMQLDSILSAD